MAWTIEIRGSNVDNEAAASGITLQVLGVRPHLIDEGSTSTSVGGRFRRRTSSRLGLDVTFHDFLVVPNGTWQGSPEYFDLMEILHARYKWIHAIGADLERMHDATNGLIALGRVTFPMAVEIYSWGDFAANFDAGINELSNIVFCSLYPYTF